MASYLWYLVLDRCVELVSSQIEADFVVPSYRKVRFGDVSRVGCLWKYCYGDWTRYTDVIITFITPNGGVMFSYSSGLFLQSNGSMLVGGSNSGLSNVGGVMCLIECRVFHHGG